MGLETPTYLDDLNTAWPLGTDKKYEGDNHIRNVKAVLANTFLKSDGTSVWDTSISVDPVDVQNGYVPIGGIIMWSSTVATIPTNWVLCNGDSGRPDLRDKFIVGAYEDYAGAQVTTLETTAGVVASGTTSGGTGNQASISTSGTAITVDQMPSHNHGGGVHTHTNRANSATGASSGSLIGAGNTTGGTGSSGTIIDTQGGGATHDHTVDYPAYYALAFIQRTA